MLEFKQASPEQASKWSQHQNEMEKAGAKLVENNGDTSHLRLEATPEQIKNAWLEMDKEKESELSANLAKAANQLSKLAGEPLRFKKVSRRQDETYRRQEAFSNKVYGVDDAWAALDQAYSDYRAFWISQTQHLINKDRENRDY